jgi:hypothetical protein
MSSMPPSSHEVRFQAIGSPGLYDRLGRKADMQHNHNGLCHTCVLYDAANMGSMTYVQRRANRFSLPSNR